MIKKCEEFIEDKKLVTGICHMILDEKGETISEATSPINVPFFNVYADFGAKNLTGLHLIRNMGLRGDTGHTSMHLNGEIGSWKDVYAVFGEWDFNYMLDKNENGDYIFNSYSLVSPCGSELVMFRGATFDEKKFLKASKKFIRETSRFVEKVDKAYDKLHSRYRRKMGALPLASQRALYNHILEEYGTLEEFIYNQGYSDLFRECGVFLM